MLFVIVGSVLFSVGGGFMRASQGFTRLGPSAVLALLFAAGAACLARAAHRHSVSSTMLIGLGLEAVGALAVGAVVVGERFAAVHLLGIALVVSGVALLRA